jgi:hypothetical protein
VILPHGDFREAKRSGIETIISRLKAGSYCAGHPPMSVRSKFGLAHAMSFLILDLTTIPREVGGTFKITGANNS